MIAIIKRSLHSALKNNGGAIAIEFALVAPLFLTLLFGIFVYGYYFASLNMVTHIAYEAARASISGLDDDERNTLAQARATELINELNGFIDPSAIMVEAAPDGGGLYAVTVEYEFDALKLVGASLLLPLPPAHQSVTVKVSHGGY